MLASGADIRKNLAYIPALILLTGCSQALLSDTKKEAESEQKSTVDIANLSPQDEQIFAQRAYAALDTYFATSTKNAEPIRLPLSHGYEKLFVTILHNGTLRCCKSGTAKKTDINRIGNDIDSATKRCIGDKRFGGPLLAHEVGNAEIVFNFFRNRRPVSTNLRQLANEVSLGMHALELKYDKKSAYFKESVPITKNYDLEKTLERLCRKIDLPTSCYTMSGAQLYAYDTKTFKTDRTGNTTELYRYNVPLEPKDITQAELQRRLALAEQWFTHNAGSGGMLEYVYYPSQNSYDSGMNHVRQIATLWSMTQLPERSQELEEMIANTFTYYQRFIECNADRCTIHIDEQGKLAYNAFMILALLHAPETQANAALRDKLAAGILHQQRTDGSYSTYFGKDSDSGINFYPGEAMLALMQLYEKTGNEKYVQSVRSAFSYYRDYWRENRSTAFVPWHIQANLLLYKATRDQQVADFVFEMADWLIRGYQITESAYKDYVGGVPKNNPGCSTSTHMEGINDAYALAKMVGDEPRQNAYRESIRNGTRFILLSQYTPENTFYLSNRKRAIGGFRASLINNQQRNDYTQHAVSAIMKAMQNKIFE